MNRTGGRAARLLALLATACAALLFAYALRRAGTGEVLQGVAQVGWRFAFVVLLAGARLFVRAAVWRLCFDEPGRVSLRAAWSSHVIGTGVGHLTPIGFAVGEGLKAATARKHVGFGPALAAVAVANLLYTLSLLLFIAGGTAALLAAYDPPPPLLLICRVTIPLALAGAAGLAFVLARRGGGSGDDRENETGAASGALARWSRRLGLHAAVVRAAEQADGIGSSVGGFCARHPSRIPAIALLEICFHLAGVAEVWITLTVLEGAPAAAACVALEATSAVLNVAFGFVPLGIGVDEAGAGALAAVLGLSPAAGVTVALVRKARTILWAGVGLVLLWREREALRAPGDE